MQLTGSVSNITTATTADSSGTTGTTAGITMGTTAGETTADGNSGLKFDVGAVDGGGTAGCMEMMVEAQPQPPDIMLVLDRSGSMTSLTGFMRTRWDDLLDSVMALVASYDAQVNFGARFLPPVDTPWTMECDPNDPHNTEVEARCRTGDFNGDGYGRGKWCRYTDQAGHRGRTRSPHWALRVTGGAVHHFSGRRETNTCGTPPEIEALLAAAYNGGNTPTIKTYALSLGWEVDELQGYAEAGGSENYIPTENFEELTAALDQIVGGVISCVVELDPPPPHPDSIDVSVDGVAYEKVDDCASESGWVWTSADKDAIELCGAACSQLKEIGVAEIVYHCPLG